MGGNAGRPKKDLEKVEFALVSSLLAVFGSLAGAAAVQPRATAVALTGAAVYFLSQMLQMSIFVTNIASMLGIGVAVDYSLFILSRYRKNCTTGRSKRPARPRCGRWAWRCSCRA